ncbi:MAG: CHRD domain-containing protein [Gemmatimonadaceae bacterium]|nr:CHRD domain-containing protein [Gemmatimonadaceae bacterium]
MRSTIRRGTRPRTLAMLLACSGTIALTACGGSGDTAAAPVVAASISVTSAATGQLVSFGETRTLSASVLDAKSAVIASPSVTWTTSNANVATVAGAGASAVVTATGNGTATITATSGAVSATAVVEVAQKFATLTVSAASASLGIGATTQLTALAKDARGNTITTATGFKYSTSDRTKALVDTASGLVTTIAPGSATMTATLTRDGVTASGTAGITVNAPAVGAAAATVQANNSNAFAPSSVTVAEGGTVTWTFGTVEHNVVFQTAGAPTSIPVTSSASVQRTFASAGTFAYVCSLHAGMSGTVNVAAASLFAQMNGANERPNANTSGANGAAIFTRSGNTVSFTVAYQGIASNPTGLHIHAPANATQTTGIAVDLLRTTQMGPSGVLTGTFTTTDIRSVAGQPAVSLDSLMTLIRTGNAYVNVHSSAFPGGEIRGQTGNP